jgi:hypothetical protein
MDKEQHEHFPETLSIRETQVAGKVLATTFYRPRIGPNRNCLRRINGAGR